MARAPVARPTRRPTRSHRPWLVLALLAGGLLAVGSVPPGEAAGTFRAATSTNTSGSAATSLAISVPSGTQANDLLLAQLAVSGGAAITITPPSGWTLVSRANSDDTVLTDLAQAIYRRTATGSEPASYTWSFTSGAAAGAMLAYSGIDTDIPIDAVTSDASNSVGVLNPTAPAVTSRFDSQTVVHFVAKNAAVTFTPSGSTTERTDSGASAPGTESSDETQATAGTTSARTATSTGVALASFVGHSVALRTASSGIKLRDVTLPATSAPTTSLGLTPPTSTTQYDVMVAQVVVNNGATITAPGGWTLIDARTTGSSTGDVGQSIYWKAAAASEVSAYTWTSSANLDGALFVYAGVDTTSPVDVASSQANAASTTVTAPGVTTTKANGLLLGFFASDAGTSDPFSTSTGMYERVDTGQSPVVSMASGDFAFAADEKALGAAGSVSSFTSTSSSSQKNIGTAVVLRPVEVAFSGATSQAYEAAGSASVTTALSSPTSLPITATYSATGGTATGSGTDYTLASGTLSFTAGATSPTSGITVTVVDDAAPDGGSTRLDETVIITLASPTNANLGSQSTHTLTILDDEPQVEASIVDGAGAAVGDAWGGWTAVAGASDVASSNYLKVENINPDPSQRPDVTVDFTPSTFAGASEATQTLALDSNIRFACVEDATGAAAPNTLTFPSFGSASGTGSTTFTFNDDTGSVVYCRHQLATIADPTYDQVYEASFTVVGV